MLCWGSVEPVAQLMKKKPGNSLLDPSEKAGTEVIAVTRKFCRKEEGWLIRNSEKFEGTGSSVAKTSLKGGQERQKETASGKHGVITDGKKHGAKKEG